jgi:hypothetical protein
MHTYNRIDYKNHGHEQLSTVTSVSSLTSVGTLATCTMSAAHGLITGDTVTMAGAVEGDYNGSFEVTVTGATTFTYVMGGDPTSPATGTPTMAGGKRLTVPAGAKFATITAGSTAARLRDDGTAPTDTVGIPLAINQSFWYAGNLSALQFYQSTGGSTIDASYYS